MKKSLLLLAALFAATPAIAHGAQETTTTPTAASDQKGTIVMFRGGSIVGAGVACPIMAQGKEITELARGKYSTWSVEPGTYMLNDKKNGVEVTVAAGETKYVRCSIKMGILAGKPKLKLVDAAEYAKDTYEEKSLTVGAN